MVQPAESSPRLPFPLFFSPQNILGKAFLFSYLLLFASCYSVRLSVKNASATPAGPIATEKGYWRDKQMNVIDTTVRLGLMNNEVMYMADCPEGYHTVEYRVSLGHVLLNAITFGKVRKIKVKYACVKPQNN
ncbi:MAG: hypothetical protein WC716_02465 [Chitinophagaceae bacterium]|jgi:hypothetical protein